MWRGRVGGRGVEGGGHAAWATACFPHNIAQAYIHSTIYIYFHTWRGHSSFAICVDTTSCLGQFGEGKMNENGQRLLELCTFHDLCITNSFFCTKPKHMVSWRHPHSKHWHQLDMILVRRAAIKNVLHTHSYHRSGRNQSNSTRQSQRGSIILMSVRYLNQTSWSSSLRLLRRNLDPCNLMTLPQRSGKLCTTLCTAQLWRPMGSDPQNHMTGSKPDQLWWPPSLEPSELPLQSTNALPVRGTGSTDSQDCQEQGSTDCCTNEYWTELSEDIQSAAITGNNRGIYDSIKKALGPTLNKTAPLRSSTGEVITYRGHQLETWVEHYLDIYSRENTVSPSALDAVECLQTLEGTRHRASFGGAQQGHRQLGLWQGPRQRWSPPRPNKALQDHLTAFSTCTPLSVLARMSCTTRHAGH